MDGTSGHPNRTVVVAAWVGSTNLGDELIHRALVRRLRGLGADPLALSVAPDATMATHGDDAVRRGELGSWLPALRRGGGLVLGGGGLVQARSSSVNLPYHLAPVIAARSAHAPVAAVGLGASHLGAASRSLVRAALRTVPTGARDRPSARALRDAGCRTVEVTGDLALSLPSSDVAERDAIAVSLRPTPVGGVLPASRSWRRGLPTDRQCVAIARTLERLAVALGLEIRFIALQADRDGELHELIAQRISRASVECVEPTVGTVVDELAASRIVVGMRYHALVGALLAGRPAVALPYDAKVVALAEDAPRSIVLPRRPVSELDPSLIEDALDRATDARSQELHVLRQREAGNLVLLEQLAAA